MLRLEGLGGITSNEVTPRFGVTSTFSKEDGDLDF